MAEKIKAVKKTTKQPEKPDLKQREDELRQKYSNRKIVKGSLTEAGKTPGFGNKCTVKIKCDKCDAERQIATSDLHQVSLCVDCTNQKKRKQNSKTPKKPSNKATNSEKSASKKTAHPKLQKPERKAQKNSDLDKILSDIKQETDQDVSKGNGKELAHSKTKKASEDIGDPLA